MPDLPEKQEPDLHRETAEIEITRQIASHNSFIEHLEAYREIVENINDVTYRLDTEGHFTYISPVIEYKTGFKPEAVIGRPFQEFVHPNDLPQLVEKFRARISVEDSPPESVDFRALKKSGDYLWVRTSSRRLRRGDKIIGIVGVWRDITARRQAEESLLVSHRKLAQRVQDGSRLLSEINRQLEQELETRKSIEKAVRESEEHLRSLMEAASNFAVYRLAYDETWPMLFRVVFVSPSIKDLFGVDATEEIEKWQEVIHPDDIERVLEANSRAFETRMFDETFRIYHGLKKELRWVHAVSTGITDETGWTKYVNGIFIDVTEQKRAEETLKEREKELQAGSKHLEDVNTALRVLLEKREEDRRKTEEKIVYNLKELISPYLEKLKDSLLKEKQASYLQVIESNLQTILSPFSKSLSEQFLNLTPAELQVVNLIRQGRSTKEIAQILTISPRTVESHRKSIRKKLNLNNRKTNLRSHLISLSRERP